MASREFTLVENHTNQSRTYPKWDSLKQEQSKYKYIFSSRTS